jgi:DNA-binding response OmpR family regulator
LELPVKRFDLIVMDRLLHGKDSAVLMAKIKERIPDAKVMVLSAINSSTEKAALLNAGADDYLAKPFDSQELIARIRALLRRNRPDLQCGNVNLDSDNRLLKVENQELALTNKEFVLLRTLVENPGKIFGKTYLYEKVWGVNGEIDSNAVEATVTKLRRRLEELGANIHIKNTRNLGYWIEE